MNEIAKNPNVSIQTMDDVERAAAAMSKSGFFKDASQLAQAVVKILAGQELGFGAFASMTGVNIIQGKPVLSANLLAAAVKRGGKYNYRVTMQTEKECIITWFEDKKEVGQSSYTMDEATRAGLSLKDNWKKYPSDMLFARAISRGQKRFAPDIFNGATVYTPDELGAVVDADGDVISVDAKQELSHREKLIDRITELMAKAASIGIDVKRFEVTDEMSEESITALGIELSEEIKANEGR